MRVSFFAAAASIASLVAFGAACSPNDNNTEPEPKADAGENDAAEPDSDSGTDGELGTDGGSSAERAACRKSCTDNHPGLLVYGDANRDCVCGSNAACASVCETTMCVDLAMDSDEACNRCFLSDFGAISACFAAAEKACRADSDCNQGLNCANACPRN
jgi:hypothetical protein